MSKEESQDVNHEESQNAKERPKSPKLQIVILFKTHGFSGGLKVIWKSITIEPLVFLSLFSMVISVIPTSYLMFERVCRLEQGYNETMCKNILYDTTSTYKDEKEILQSKAANWMMIGMGLGMIPDIIVKLLAGAWSDRHGRKPIIFYVLFGIFLKQVGLLLVLYYKDASVWWLIVASLTANIFSAQILFPISIAYISDITTHQNRTFRILYMQFLMFAGIIVGQFCGGTIATSYGYEVVFLLSACGASAAFLYCIFILKESTGKPSKTMKEALDALKDIFVTKHLKEIWRTLKVKRSGYKRMHLMLLLACSLVDQMLMNCHRAIDLLYTQAMYNWTAAQFSQVSTIIYIADLILCAIGIAILMGKLKLADIKIAVIGCTSHTVSYTVTAFSFKYWVYYVGRIAACLGLLPDVVIQSNLTKVVHRDEIGKALMFRSVLTGLAGPETNIAFVALYKATKGFFHGFTYLFTGCFYLVPLSLFVIMHLKPVNYDEDKENKIAPGECVEHIAHDMIDSNIIEDNDVVTTF